MLSWWRLNYPGTFHHAQTHIHGNYAADNDDLGDVMDRKVRGLANQNQ